MFVTFTHADDGRLETVSIDRIVSVREAEPAGEQPDGAPAPPAGCEVTVDGLHGGCIVTAEDHKAITQRLADALRHYRGRR